MRMQAATGETSRQSAPSAWRFVTPQGEQIWVYDGGGAPLWCFDLSTRSQHQVCDPLDQDAWQLIAKVLAQPELVPYAIQPAAATAAPMAVEAEPVAPPPDLATQRPGHALLFKLAELHAAATAYGPGALSDEFVRYAVGFVGEERVGAELARLGADWHVLHSVPVGTASTDIDHVVIGPGGVFTLNTKHHAGGRVDTRGGERVFVGGAWVPYARKSVAEAKRATELLRAASPWPGTAQPLIVVVGARLDIRAPLDGVIVLAVENLVHWLLARPQQLTAAQAAYLFAVARRPGVWSGSATVRDAPEWAAEVARAVATDHAMAQQGRRAARPSAGRGARQRANSGHSPARGRRGAPSGRPAGPRRPLNRAKAASHEGKRLLVGVFALLALLVFAKPLVRALEDVTRSAVTKVVPTPKPMLGGTCSPVGAHAVDAAGVALTCAPSAPNSAALTWRRP